MCGVTAVRGSDINNWAARSANQISAPDDCVPENEDYMVIKPIPDCRDL